MSASSWRVGRCALAASWIAVGVARAQFISSVEPTSPARSARLVIRGGGFTDAPGRVEVAGIAAPVTTWTDARIVCYVPESAPPGATTVRVVVGSTASQPITVIQRPAQEGRIKWRFDGDAYYFISRPAIAPDGSIYATDIFGHLYALRSGGGLKWLKNDVNGGVSPAVGADGTVYVDVAGGLISALDPQTGSEIWTVPNPPNTGTIGAGPTVGPDGKIYMVTEQFFGSIGAIAVTADGQIAWTEDFGYDWRHYPSVQDIAFADGQMLFCTGREALSGVAGLHAITLDGSHQWNRLAYGQVLVSDGGHLYLNAIENNYVGSYTSDGTLRWRVGYNQAFSQPNGRHAVGPDGSVYQSFFYHNRLYSYSAIGEVRWFVELLGPDMPMSAMLVLPDNSAVVGAAYPFNSIDDYAIQAVSPADGSLLWQQPLGRANGAHVSQFGEARLAPDGRTYYAPCAGYQAMSDPIAPLIAIDVRAIPSPSGDMNCDGSVNSFDIQGFLTALSDPAGYAGQYPGCDINNADVNSDGTTNPFDIQGFVALLMGP